MSRSATLTCGSRILLAVVLLTSRAWGDEALDQLVKNARYWQERARPDKAVEAWRRVLVADPGNVDALLELGTAHARQGRLDKAREVLARLREAHPGDPAVLVLEQAVATGGGYDQLIARARQLARDGKPAEAVATYRRAFGGGGPQGELAIEYYQTLGGMPQGWEEAEKGLERLAAKTGRAADRLALSKHLTYREKSRRQGIGKLRDLVTDPAVGDEATKAWRQALLWLQAGPADAELFTAYQAQRGIDPEITKRIEELRVVSNRPAPSSSKAGFEALERSDVDDAKRLFENAAANNKRDPQALVGLGVVALQQQDFVRAREIFTKVKTLAPDQPNLWQQSLRSANFFVLLREGEAARRAGRMEEADRKLGEAARLSPEERAVAEVARADLARERGALADAEVMLKPILEAEPKNATALEALLRVQLAGLRGDDADETNGRLAEIDPARAFAPQKLRAELLRGQAAAARSGGALEKARTQLVEARRIAPESPEVLVDLAYLQLELDDIDGARAAADSLARLSPHHVEVVRLQVRMLEAERRYTEALQRLATFKDKDLDEVWRGVKERLEVRAEAGLLVGRAGRGALAGSRLRLADLERRIGGKPELILVVAEAWADIGDGTRAVSLAQKAAARVSELPVGSRLQLAAVYLRAERDTELTELLRDLGAESHLSPREKGDLDRLRAAQAVRRADRLRDRGELEPALKEITPLLREEADNPRLLCALGRIYKSANENGEGHAVFLRVLARDPDDLEARQGAIETALGMHDRDAARTLTEEGLQRAPSDPRMHLLAGRFSVLIGEDAAANTSFRTAMDLLGRDSVRSGAVISALAMDRGGSDVVDVAAAKLGGRFAGGDAGGVERDARLPLEIQAEIDRLNAKRNVDVRAEFKGRTREGYGGFAGLTELRVPVTASVPLGFYGRLNIVAAPVVLDTGDVATSREVVERFGTIGLDPTTLPQDSLSRSVSGASLGLSYAYRWLSLDIGSTPLGLPLQAVVGGASLRGQVGRVGLAATTARRSVTDSMLSYVGMRDPGTGVTWGRVLADGARADLSVATEPALVYVFGGFARLKGEQVATNLMFLGGTGVEWPLYDFDETSFVTGVGLSYLGYQKNLRYFSLGHGGYFSPQRFLHAGVPLKGRGHEGSLRWEVIGDLGLNWFLERQASYYPADESLQAARGSLSDGPEHPAESTYAGQRNLSLAFDLVGRASYLLGSQMEAGVEVAVRRADYFREFVGGFYLQIGFRRKLLNRPAGL
jgi:tetratricopeptide (TPR) repeat protein